jgi:hypothetical protein
MSGFGFIFPPQCSAPSSLIPSDGRFFIQNPSKPPMDLLAVI